MGVLEDARVECHALQHLPGLRDLWLPFHAGPAAAQGMGFDALLGRLARSLLDPLHVDPHPWVAKARAVFFDADGQSVALQTPEAVRQAASLLGADIGQMRLPFNGRSYRVHAAYRDDNSHLWQQDNALPPSDTPLDGGQGTSALPEGGPTLPMVLHAAPVSGDRSAPQPTDAPVAVYPEWDHIIGRYRPDWCQVFSPSVARSPLATGGTRPSIKLVQALSGLEGAAVRTGGRVREGDELHIGALVDTRIDQYLQCAPYPRIYRRVVRPAPPLAVLMLLDASASTTHSTHGGGATMLDHVRAAAHATSLALQAAGHRTASWAFSTDGRHRINMPCLKQWDEPANAPAVAERIAALRSVGSTRLGAVLRHAMALCRADAAHHPGWNRVIVLVTDGEPHDIDVHHPGYLQADLRRAAQEAGRGGLAVRGLLLPPGDGRTLAHCLGRTNCATLPRMADLPKQVAALLGGVT